MTFDEAQKYLLENRTPGAIYFSIKDKESGFFLHFHPDNVLYDYHTFNGKDLGKLIIEFVEWIKSHDHHGGHEWEC